VTGLNGTTQRVAGPSDRVLDRPLTVRFDTTTAPGLPWTFKPVQNSTIVRVGEQSMALFEATNNSDHEITGSAVFNVTPEITGRYFDKIQCFCFSLQTLKAREHVTMPVVFYVDPAIIDEPGASNVQEITLSYTFFEAKTGSASASNAGTEAKPPNGT
jgi:cytochrome c oxidase assembly protein subunit 11